MMFDSAESIPPETRLEVEAYGPVDCEKRTRLYMLIGAQVQWTREIPEAFEYKGSNRYRVGVSFDRIDSSDQRCLDEYVKKRLMMGSSPSIT